VMCEIAFCPNEGTEIVATVRDLPERAGDAVTYVSLHVCDGHRDLLDADPNHLAVDARDQLIERPQRKPADWCLICDGSCTVGYPGIAAAHNQGGDR
jgi:hypothetical protein